MEGNVENQLVFSEFQIQGPVNLPEFARMGLRVDVDPQTQRAKPVSTSEDIDQLDDKFNNNDVIIEDIYVQLFT
ncbi:hypothetical protein Tco_0612205 [Tanacetum coccineum]